MAEMMSKMMGQLAWEKRAVAGGKTEKEAREAFRSRYGISYLQETIWKIIRLEQNIEKKAEKEKKRN